MNVVFKRLTKELARCQMDALPRKGDNVDVLVEEYETPDGEGDAIETKTFRAVGAVVGVKHKIRNEYHEAIVYIA